MIWVVIAPDDVDVRIFALAAWMVADEMKIWEAQAA
jgi:hypothetical protein